MSALALGFLLGAALAGAAYWLGYRAGRRANWAAGERIIGHLLDELDLYEQAERESLSETPYADTYGDLVRMH